MLNRTSVLRELKFEYLIEQQFLQMFREISCQLFELTQAAAPTYSSIVIIRYININLKCTSMTKLNLVRLETFSMLITGRFYGSKMRSVTTNRTQWTYFSSHLFSGPRTNSSRLLLLPSGRHHSPVLLFFFIATASYSPARGSRRPVSARFQIH